MADIAGNRQGCYSILGNAQHLPETFPLLSNSPANAILHTLIVLKWALRQLPMLCTHLNRRWLDCVNTLLNTNQYGKEINKMAVTLTDSTLPFHKIDHCHFPIFISEHSWPFLTAVIPIQCSTTDADITNGWKASQWVMSTLPPQKWTRWSSDLRAHRFS